MSGRPRPASSPQAAVDPAAGAALAMEEVRVLLDPGRRDAGGFALEIGRFVAHRGEAIALIGESGSGKSTFLNLVGLARRPSSAATFLLRTRGSGPAHDLVALWTRRADATLTGIRARHQGYVLQQGGLLPFLDVRGNIAIALELAGRTDGGAVARIAQDLGIAHLLGRAIGEISVGERQRVAIARALVHGPDLVLADEPTANVHPSMADEIVRLLREQAVRRDALLLMATHDVGRARALGFDFVEIARGGGRATHGVSRIDRIPVGRPGGDA